jgi:hypothetical protein
MRAIIVAAPRLTLSSESYGLIPSCLHRDLPATSWGAGRPTGRSVGVRTAIEPRSGGTQRGPAGGRRSAARASRQRAGPRERAAGRRAGVLRAAPVQPPTASPTRPGTRRHASPSPCARPGRRNPRPASPSLASSRHASIRASPGGASTRGICVSCSWQQCGVPEAPTSDLSAGSRRQESGDVGRMTGTFSSVAGGRPRPWEAYQRSTAQRHASQHFPRSCRTVNGAGMG